MTALRQKMIENMQLRGLSVRTQESYVQAVSQLARHYHKPPDQIIEEELRQYFLYLKTVRHVSRSTQTIALCGIKFFYEHTQMKGEVKDADELRIRWLNCCARERKSSSTPPPLLKSC